MSCQAIKHNGNPCTKPAKDKYDGLYCSKHKHWLELEEVEDVEEIPEEEKVEEQVKETKKETPKEENTEMVDDDVVMSNSETMSYLDDQLVYKLMSYYHTKYMGNNSSLLTITKVLEKLNEILSSDDEVILKNTKHSNVNKERFMKLSEDFSRYLPTHEKYEVLAKMSAAVF